jgi:glycosyltransferase involved in cell wall biosynthesis
VLSCSSFDRYANVVVRLAGSSGGEISSRCHYSFRSVPEPPERITTLPNQSTSIHEPTPALTVVIPTRNRYGYLSEAIDSVRRQTFAAWEVIVVDDASDDGSADRARQLVAEDSRFRLIPLDRHHERSAARNAGFEQARGQYVLFLDDDDLLTPRALETLSEALESDRTAVVAIGARRAFDPRGQARRAPHPRFRVRRKLTFELLLGWLTAWVAVPGQCLIRTDVLRAVGGWNQTLVGPEDQELLLRLTSERPALIVPGVVLEYRLHDTQWRPPDVRAQETAFRLDVAERLSAENRPGALETVRAGELLRAAGTRYDEGRYRSAIRLLREARRRSPAILSSPIMAPPFVHLWAKSVVGGALGSGGAGFVRDARGHVRRMLRRSPRASVAILEASVPPGRAGGYRSVPGANPDADDVV